MQPFILQLARAERRVLRLLAAHAVTILRVSVGIVFLWFGVLKFFPQVSPAEDLAGRTIDALTFHLVPRAISVPVLAAWETMVGAGLISGRFLRVSLLLMFLQMVGTALPLILFPYETWARFPYAATLEGQYIIKNIVLFSAGLVIAGGARRR